MRIFPSSQFKTLIVIGEGYFAGTIGTRRVLKFLAKYDIKATWFIPGHSLETFPEDMAAVRDAGHEIGMCLHNPTKAGTPKAHDV